MSDQPNTGPSLNTLRGLKAMLPSFIKGLESKRAIGKGKIQRPRKMCRVCGKLWDHVFVMATEDTTFSAELCEACEARLKAGETAFVCADRYVFAKVPEALADMVGQVVTVKSHVMEQLEAEYKKLMDGKKNDERTT